MTFSSGMKQRKSKIGDTIYTAPDEKTRLKQLEVVTKILNEFKKVL